MQVLFTSSACAHTKSRLNYLQGICRHPQHRHREAEGTNLQPVHCQVPVLQFPKQLMGQEGIKLAQGMLMGPQSQLKGLQCSNTDALPYQGHTYRVSERAEKLCKACSMWLLSASGASQ